MFCHVCHSTQRTFHLPFSSLWKGAVSVLGITKPKPPTTPVVVRNDNCTALCQVTLKKWLLNISPSSSNLNQVFSQNKAARFLNRKSVGWLFHCWILGFFSEKLLPWRIMLQLKTVLNYNCRKWSKPNGSNRWTLLSHCNETSTTFLFKNF